MYFSTIKIKIKKESIYYAEKILEEWKGKLENKRDFMYHVVTEQAP